MVYREPTSAKDPKGEVRALHTPALCQAWVLSAVLFRPLEVLRSIDMAQGLPGAHL